MSWNSHAAQIATAKPAKATTPRTVTPTIATHFSRGGFNGLTVSRGTPPLHCRSRRLRMRRQRAQRRGSPFSCETTPQLLEGKERAGVVVLRPQPGRQVLARDGYDRAAIVGFERPGHGHFALESGVLGD